MIDLRWPHQAAFQDDLCVTTTLPRIREHAGVNIVPMAGPQRKVHRTSVKAKTRNRPSILAAVHQFVASEWEDLER